MKYQCVKQLDETDCAAACISTICQYYGLRKSITKIRELAGTDKNGTNGVGVINALHSLGFEAEGYFMDEKDLRIEDVHFPCIAHVNKDGSNHYVVVYSIEGENICIADPADGIVDYLASTFNEIWTGVLFLVEPTERMREIEPDQRNISVLKLLLQQKGLIASIVFFSFFFTLVGIASTILFQMVFDSVIPDRQLSFIGKISVGFIGIVVLGGLIQFLRVKLILLLGRRYDMELTYNSYEHIIHLPMKFFAERQTGEIISRLNDASKIRDVLSGAAICVVVDVFMAVVSGVVLVKYSGKLSIIVFFFFSLYVLVNVIFIKKIRESNKINMEKSSQTNSMFIETIKGVETIKACGAEDKVCRESKYIFEELLDSVIRSQNIECILTVFCNVISKSCYIAVLWAGAVMVINGGITAGILLTFYSLIGYFFSPVQSLMSLQTSMQGAIVAYERLSQMIECEPEELVHAEFTEQLSGEIEVRDLSFRYGSRRKVLDGISFRVAPNERVAIVGESGSGKTTVARLLLGFYEYESGEIYFDKISMKTLDKGYVRTQLAYVPQEPYFFKGTIKENVLFGNRANVTDEEIIEVMKIVKLDDYLEESPEGIYTKLQENGTNLSGGQRQRLNIARALMRKPHILILDEATSNLDVVTEKSITEAIDNLTNMTIIVIAHRLSTIKHCDRIIVMKNGRVVEDGSHDELMCLDGYYSSLWSEVRE